MITKHVKTTVFEISMHGIDKVLEDATNELIETVDEDTIVNISINALDDREDHTSAYMMMHIKSLENLLFGCDAKARYTKRAHSEAMDILNDMKKLIEVEQLE